MKHLKDCLSKASTGPISQNALNLSTCSMFIIAESSPAMQNPAALTPPSTSNDLPYPIADCESPMTCHQNTAQDIDQFDAENQKSISGLDYCEEHRLHIIFEEDSWY